MIVKIVATYDDGAEGTFTGTAEVAATPAQGVDLSSIPTLSPAQQEAAAQAQSQVQSA